MLNLGIYGTAQPFNLRHQDLIKILTQGANPVLTDPLLVNAFHMVDRALFLPDDIQTLAYQDRILPIAYDERAINPTLAARLMQIFAPKWGGRYLHLGAGTGYITTLLGFVAGKQGKVYAMERIQWFWERARDASSGYRDYTDIEILYRDGTNGLPDKAPYDGILVTFVYPQAPLHLLEQLAVGGKLVYPTNQHTLHVVEKLGEDDYITEVVPDVNAYAFGVVKDGVI